MAGASTPGGGTGTIYASRPSAAVGLIYSGLVLHVLGLVALFLDHDQVRRTTESEHPTWSATQISDEVLAHSLGTAVYMVLVNWRDTPARRRPGYLSKPNRDPEIPQPSPNDGTGRS